MLKIKPECIPCNISIMIKTSRYATSDEEMQKRILQRALIYLAGLTWEESPMDVSSDLQDIIGELTGVIDPYREIKERSNEAALRCMSRAREMIWESDDPLRTAVKIAVAGNTIDFGTYSGVDPEMSMKIAESARFSIDNYDDFSSRVLEAKRLLYFLDNAGEAIFDGLLINTMIDVRGRPFEKITLVGKERPLMNDVTLDDLKKLGFQDLPNAVIKGIGCGRKARLHARSPEIKKMFNSHDLIILKGQGNFEMFHDECNAFFLLVVKCDVVGEVLNAGKGSLILKYSESNRRI